LEENEQAELIKETMKLKIEELMKIIKETIQKFILQKEVLVLKVSLQQKDSNIRSLNELLRRKDEIIYQNDSTVEEYAEEVNQLKKEAAKKLLKIKTKLIVKT
jgi:hypothetical protein